MELHTPTLYAVGATLFVVLASVLFAASFHLAALPGLRRVALALCTVGGALGLLVASDPTDWPRVVGGVMVVLGVALLLEGILLFHGCRAERRATLLLTLAAAVGLPWLTYSSASAAGRVVAIHLVLGGLLAWGGVVAIRYGRRRRHVPSAFLTGGAMLSSSAACVARAIASGAGFVESDLVRGDWPTNLVLLVGTGAAALWTLGLIASAGERLRAELVERQRLSDSLLSVARAAAEGPDLDATVRSTLDMLRRLTGATGASLFLLNEGKSIAKAVYAHGDDVSTLPAAEAEPLMQQGLAGWVATHLSSTVVCDTRTDCRWYWLDSQRDVRSALAAPIATGDDVAAVLTLIHREPGHFTEDQRRFLDAAAAQIALALRNAQIAESRLVLSQQMRLLYDVVSASAASVIPAEIAEKTARIVAEGTGWRDVRVTSHEAEGAADEPRSVATRVSDAGLSVVVPIRHGAQHVGALRALSAGDAFALCEVRFAEAVAEAIGSGLAGAQAHRLREEVTHAIVHDLRTPLVSIIAALTLLRDAQGAPDDELIEMARRNADRLVALIDTILDASRLETGEMPVRPGRVGLSGLVAEVVRESTPAARARGVVVSADVSPDLPAAWVDEDLAKRVLENLLSNAIKFSPKGGEIHVHAAAEQSGLAVRIADEGPGIPEELRSRLFERFSAGRHPRAGNGLGLAFCRLAVAALEGRIWCESGRTAGATFVFTLPAAVGEAAPMVPAHA